MLSRPGPSIFKAWSDFWHRYRRPLDIHDSEYRYCLGYGYPFYPLFCVLILTWIRVPILHTIVFIVIDFGTGTHYTHSIVCIVLDLDCVLFLIILWRAINQDMGAHTLFQHENQAVVIWVLYEISCELSVYACEGTLIDSTTHRLMTMGSLKYSSN